MGSTTTFGHPWPAGTDLVSGGDDVIKSLAEDVEVTEKEIAAVYRTLQRATAFLSADLVAGTYLFSNTALIPSPASLTAGIVSTYLDDADFPVTGLTTKLRVRAQVSTNGTVPAITFTVGLYPVTFSGAADVLTATLGTVVAGSTVAIASPSANSTTSGASSDVNVPTDGLYCLGVVTSATLTNNAVGMVSAQLQTRNV